MSSALPGNRGGLENRALSGPSRNSSLLPFNPSWEQESPAHPAGRPTRLLPFLQENPGGIFRVLSSFPPLPCGRAGLRALGRAQQSLSFPWELPALVPQRPFPIPASPDLWEAEKSPGTEGPVP